MDYRKQIGARIAEIRNQRGLTQLELAKKIDMKQQSLSRVEAGLFDTKIDTVGKIAAALGCKIELVEK